MNNPRDREPNLASKCESRCGEGTACVPRPTSRACSQKRPYLIEWRVTLPGDFWLHHREWSVRGRYKTNKARDQAMEQFKNQGRSGVEYRAVDALNS